MQECAKTIRDIFDQVGTTLANYQIKNPSL